MGAGQVHFQAALSRKRLLAHFARELRRFAALETFVRVETRLVLVALIASDTNVVVRRFFDVIILNKSRIIFQLLCVFVVF